MPDSLVRATPDGGCIDVESCRYLDRGNGSRQRPHQTPWVNPWRGAGGAGDELVSPDGRLKPDAAPATGFSLSTGLERVA